MAADVVVEKSPVVDKQQEELGMEQEQELKETPVADVKEEEKQVETEDKQPEAAAVPQGNMEALQKLARKQEEPAFKLEDNVKERRTGFFIFAKTWTTDELMRWSKKAIPNGSLLGLNDDEAMKEHAAKCFEDLQRIMGDRKMDASPKRNQAERIQVLLEKGLFNVKLRDELYLQLIKQLTDNPSAEGVAKGWQVMCCYVSAFPPSIRMDRWTVQWIAKWCGEKGDGKQEDICKMAAYAHKKLERLCQVGPKGHLPTVGEIERFVIAPFHPSPFGETLVEIMKHPELVDESGRYPKILIFLSEAVLKLGGCSTEGIFRVPGDIEGVTALKLRIENGDYSLEERMRDPSVPASLLKLWLRELAEPLIPTSFYEMAIKCPVDRPDAAIGVLDELPEVNLLVAKYLVKFLQLIGDPRYQPVTKMNISNLAMVFAPSFLRCPSDNPLTILANSRLEQAYLKTLINYLEE